MCDYFDSASGLQCIKERGRDDGERKKRWGLFELVVETSAVLFRVRNLT